MKLIYNGFDFSSIGEVTLKWKRDYEGGEAPQRCRVTVEACISVFERSYGDNYALLIQAQEAVSSPNEMLTWTNDATGEEYINQTATVTAQNFPEEWGTYFQQLELSFQYYEAMDTADQNMLCSFAVTGSSQPAMTFGNILKWSESASAKRFSQFRSQREQVVGTLTVQGLILGDTTLTLAQRRSALAAIVAQYRAQMNSAQGTLVYGPNGSATAMFNQVVRITSFDADVNQAINAVEFKFTAEYTMFPNEANYATVEATAEMRDPQTGEYFLNVNGKIQATSEAIAQAKLAVVIATFLKNYNFAAGQKLNFTVTPNLISANADGDTFTELVFSGEWRTWSASNMMATYQATPQAGAATNPPVSLGNVSLWAEGYKAERFDVMRSQRRNATDTITASGTIAGKPNVGLATLQPSDLRAQLLAMEQALMAQCFASGDGTLTFGNWSRTVRVETFTAKINQAVTGIDWALTANYVLFPTENYATVEATAEERDPKTGELYLICSGKIQAASEAVARTKLGLVLAGFVTTYGYTKGEALEIMTTPNLISANGDGDTFTELVFSAHWRKWRASNMLATFLHTGGTGAPIGLGNVSRWDEGYKAERFDILRSQRKNATDTISAGGTFSTPNVGLASGLSLVNRRAELLKQQRALLAECNNADGVLTFGDWSQTVRVETFTARINQAETGIDWTLTASYVLFPTVEYATVEATAEQRDPKTGELYLTCSGKIQAASEAVARMKLGVVMAAFIATYGYASGQMMDFMTTPNLISANGDGDTFTELTFSARLRKWRSDNFIATFLPNVDGTPASEAVTMGNISTWEDGIKSDRFDVMRSQRRRTAETITATGVFAADMTLSDTDRKAQLLAQQRAMTAACTNADGMLNYGQWSQTVRVESFTAKINQAITGIDWSLSAYYNPFPDETDYTTVEATAESKDGMNGETFLNVQGKIQATSAAVALMKLGVVVATFCNEYGYTGSSAQQLELVTTPNLISANADGDTFTELTFSGQWRNWQSTNQMATFTQTGHTKPVPLGNVRTWDDDYKAERFDVMRSERRHATGMVSAGGTFSVDPSQTLTVRRAALLAQQRALKAEVNGADGTLVFGDWTQVVRVEDFTAKVNQAETGIDWTLTATYTLFPNEGGYATCDFTADQKQDVETGDSILSFAGEVLAPNGSMARAKLTSIRTATLGIYGFNVNQLVRGGSQARDVSANGDATAGIPEGMETEGDVPGVSFIRLTFNEEYRQRSPGVVVSSKYRIDSRDDTASGLMMTTYSGSVTASGSNADVAMAAAAARAMAIGANQEGSIDSTAFLKSQQWQIEKRQLTTAAPAEFVVLTFSYEYQSKIPTGRSYVECNTATNLDTFGTDSVTVSGFVVARDQPTATAIYQAQVLAPYTTSLVRSQTTTFDRVMAEQSVSTGLIFTGPQNPTPPVSFTTQMLRLNFNFVVFQAKAAGRMTARYSLNVTRDFLQLKLSTHVRGSVFAATRAAADALITTLFGDTTGSLVSSNRNEDHDYTPQVNAFIKLDFDDDYEAALAGVAGILECRVTEQVKYSSTRWALQPLPYDVNGGGGITIVQPAGVAEGSRVVRGSVTAATLAAAQAWAWEQQSLLTGDADGGNYPQPPEMENDYEFAPRINGIAEGPDENVRLFRVTFTLAEILPNYPAPI